ncbi:DUF4402 domain-containing protein [Phenylobacterium sp.]|uniref:DUF4402 domain-containing protein n=1 Tax=Phenylobacterium sp. TaxID=1871053 RepID=UPI0035B29A0E
MTTLRNLLIAAGSAVALASLATAAAAQTPSGPANPAPTPKQADAQMSVTIQSPLTVTKDSDLAFGTLIKPVSGNALPVTLASSNGQVTYNNQTTSGTPAVFTVTSSAGTTFTPTYTASGAITSLPGFAVLTPTGAQGADAPGGLTGNMGQMAIGANTTTRELRYGATFNLGPAVPPGLYSGNLNVTVNYQ